MPDFTAVFVAVRDGGPSVIFVLVLNIALIVSGILQPRGVVVAELQALDRANQAGIEARDQRIAELVRLQEQANRRLDEQTRIFDSAMSLIRNDLLPIVRGALGGK